MLADSGNGAHLLYRIEMPTDDGGLVQQVLQALAFRFDDDIVHVDQTTFNPARIWKLYGTRACKGDPTTDRPHRMARVLETPDDMAVVTQDQLEHVGGWLPTVETATKDRSGLEPAGYGPASGFDLDGWIAQHDLDVEGPYGWGQERTALDLRGCPWDESHNDRSAYLAQFSSGAVAAGCHHNGCTGHDWHALRMLVEPDLHANHIDRPRLELVTGEPVAATALAWEPPIPLKEFDLPVFPVDALPDWLGTYVTALAEATQTPPDLGAMVGLSALSTCAARIYAVRAQPDWIEPLNLYTVTVLPPASRKSAVFSKMTGPLETAEEELVRELAPEIAEASGRRRILAERLRHTESLAAKVEDSSKRLTLEGQAKQLTKELAACEVPATPRLLADDVSPEKVANLLAEQQGRLSILSAEGDLFEIMTGRYSKAGPNIGVFLKAHAGDTIRVDRIGRAPEYITMPALTIGLTVQQQVLRGMQHAGQLRGKGLLARFLYSLPESGLGYRRAQTHPVPDYVKERYTNQVERLAWLKPNRTPEGKPVPHELALTPRAEELLIALLETIEVELRPAGSLGTIPDWGGKLAGAIVRIAGLMHLADSEEETFVTRPAIGVGTLANAIRVGNYLMAHARAAYAELGADPVVEEAEYLLGRIESRNWTLFTKRDLFEMARSRVPQAAELDRPLELLVDHGFLRRIDKDRGGPGRKPSPEFEVNPLWLPQTTHNPHNSGSLLELVSETGDRAERDSLIAD
ncbi:MAG: YfjI family protein [Thermomicrobiales bacterium]